MPNTIVLTILSVLSFFGYTLTNKRPYKHVFETRFDKRVKPWPIFVIPYLGLFPFIGLTYLLLLSSPYYVHFIMSIFIVNTLATLFWVLVPNGVKREPLEEKCPFSKTINFIYSIDGDRNGFPSGHVFLSLICSYYLIISSIPFTGLWALIGLLIAFSTVLTKQHYVIDILGGHLFTVVALVSSFYLIS